MEFNRPEYVGSATSGVDGASEGGRVSSSRQPLTLMIYAVPLLKELHEAGYSGKLDATPGLVNGSWVLQVRYAGEVAPEVPATWMGHRVIAVPAAKDG
ncbi:MAG: hypothetical protein M3024_11870 [Candidatus Dormibacteraeota bacterium]|nr:hypothetical protein [Candidatus Dormibacteraeota bacterium]